MDEKPKRGRPKKEAIAPLPDIVLPYKPRPIWANSLHKVMDTYQNVVLVAHRRFGKTVGLINQLIKMALQSMRLSPRFAYIAPFLKQAKMVAWEYLKYYTNPIPGLKVNNQDLYIEFPSHHQGAAGARIYILGSDNPDSIRGTYWDAVILDEFAQMDNDLFGKVITPALSDRDGKCFIIGTPNGEDQFYEKYQYAQKQMVRQKSKRWYAALYRADESGIFSEDKLAEIQEDLTEAEYRQEYLCDFTVSAYNVVIPLQLITESANRLLTDKDKIPNTPVILGVDVARMGDDRTTIWRREGFIVDKPRIYKHLNNMAVADMVLLAMHDWKPDAVFIDVGGTGSGPIDRLRQLGYTNIFEVPFGSRAMDNDRFENVRTEMYFKIKEWMEAGGAIPNIMELKQELSTPRFKFSKRSKIILEEKDKIKERIGKSPDLADGLALTFAKPVMPRFRNGSPEGKGDMLMCNTDYSVMEAI